MKLEFTVPAVPVPQPRAKPTRRGKFMSVFTPDTVRTPLGSKPHPIVEFKHAVRVAARAAMGSTPPLECALRVELGLVFPRVKNLRWKTRPMPRLHHVGKPDVDNVSKAILDSLKEIVLRDDTQVCQLVAFKWIAAGSESPHVTIQVEEAQEP